MSSAGASGAGGGDAGSGGGALGGSGGAPEVDAGGGAGGGQGGSTGSSLCPEIAPRPVPGQTVAIVALNIVDAQLRIRNVSSSPIEIDATGANDWQWCAFPTYAGIVAQDTVLGPGEDLDIDISASFARELSGGEIAIYDSVSFSSSESMQAYVAWNVRLEQGREDVASEAGLWTYLDRVEVRQGHSGFFATGPTDEASGYTSVPRFCFSL